MTVSTILFEFVNFITALVTVTEHVANSRVKPSLKLITGKLYHYKQAHTHITNMHYTYIGETRYD